MFPQLVLSSALATTFAVTRRAQPPHDALDDVGKFGILEAVVSADSI